MLCLDAAPRRTFVGYVDDMVLPEYQRPYETREALWREEVFEPFLSWVNDVLAPACCLGIWQTEEGGATWANLLAPRATWPIPTWLKPISSRRKPRSSPRSSACAQPSRQARPNRAVGGPQDGGQLPWVLERLHQPFARSVQVRAHQGRRLVRLPTVPAVAGFPVVERWSACRARRVCGAGLKNSPGKSQMMRPIRPRPSVIQWRGSSKVNSLHTLTRRCSGSQAASPAQTGPRPGFSACSRVSRSDHG